MERLCYLVAAAIVLGAAAMFGLNTVKDPLEPKRAWLEAELAHVPSDVDADGADPWEFDTWQAAISAKPKVWDALIPPPPKPKPPPPPPPKPPDIKKMLEGVKPTRISIGKRVKIIHPGNAKGELFGEGDAVGMCKVKSFDRTEVIFSYYWTQGKKELTHTLPRKR